jgi:tRNA A-37 threonylcarbamoyl transferase component Bud32
MAIETKSHGSLIGTKLGGYQVEALIGRGAMGSVYLARDTKLNRHVALKVLLGSLSRTPSIVKQFRQEAQAAAPLNHPNIVRIYSAGMESGTPYIAMEFVDGEPLDRFLGRQGKVSWEVALHVGAQVAAALDCAHRHGIIHRDVKPSNILVDRRGGVRLTDFGIARMQSEGTGKGASVVGTPQYMSPEQVTGKDIGPTSDLFSLGVTMYQMIAGELPFRGESSMALVKSICEDDPPRLNRVISSVPDDVARLVAYLMEKEPGGRPASSKVAYGLIHRLQKQRGVATSVADSITAFLQEEMEPRPFSSIERKRAQARKSSRRVKRKSSAGRRLLWLALNVALIAALAAGAFTLGPLIARRARAAPAHPASDIGLADAGRLMPGVRRVSLYTDGFSIRDLTWAGDNGTLVVRMRGERGGLMDGESGVIAIDTEADRVLSIVPPFASGQGSLETPGEVAGVGSPLTMSNKGPFAGALPVLASGDGARSLVLLAQDVRSSTPRPEIYFQTTDASLAALDGGSGVSAASSIAIHPGGETVCLVLRDPADGHTYLVERDVYAKPLDLVSEPRTTASADVLPGSVQYTPDGRRIGYIARTRDGQSVLRLINTGESQRDGQDIVSSVAGVAYSISPEGNWAAVALDIGESMPRVALVDISLRKVVRHFGPGHVSRQAWLPGGETFVYSGYRSVADSERSIDPQLIQADAAAPDAEPRVLVQLPGGAGDAYAVSDMGGPIAAEVRGKRGSGVYLIDTHELSF